MGELIIGWAIYELFKGDSNDKKCDEDAKIVVNCNCSSKR